MSARAPGSVVAAGGTGPDAFLARDEAPVLRGHGHRARPDVVASFGPHRYAWPACLPITVPWFLPRRAPGCPWPTSPATAPPAALHPASHGVFRPVRPEDTRVTCPRARDRTADPTAAA